MSESELEGFIQVAPYPLEAVPYQLFAKMIGRKESTVRTMIDAAKLPTLDFTKPGSVKTRASENWIYLPAFNAGMRKAFLINRKNNETHGCCGWGFEMTNHEDKTLLERLETLKNEKPHQKLLLVFPGKPQVEISIDYHELHRTFADLMAFKSKLQNGEDLKDATLRPDDEYGHFCRDGVKGTLG